MSNIEAPQFGSTAELREQITRLQPEAGDRIRFQLHAERIRHPDLLKRVDERRPIFYVTPGLGLPGLGFGGGLELLSSDHFLEAVDLGQDTWFVGGAYSVRERPIVVHDEATNTYHQEIIEEKLPSPEELGMRRVDNLNINIYGEKGPKHITVWEYPIKSKHTHLLLLELDGKIYPENASTDARLWNDAVLGFGTSQIIRQLEEQHIIDHPSLSHFQESQMILGALGILDNLVCECGDSPKSYDVALRTVRDNTLLTSHTLVPYAEAKFSQHQYETFIFSNLRSTVVKKCIQEFITERKGIFAPLEFALYIAGKYNAVSVDNAKIATDIFQKEYGNTYYGGQMEIKGITNGIYEKRWNKPMVNLLERHNVIDSFGLLDPDAFKHNLRRIPDDELISIKTSAITAFQRYLHAGRRKDQFGRQIAIPDNAVILGDARRVVEYKRRWMIFVYPDRLRSILKQNDRAYYFLSGKAHPDDGKGQEHLSFILNTIASDALFRERVFYLPDWEPDFASTLIAASSIWLNTPEVGLEACGTSGMKAAIGGALNISTPDGWLAKLPYIAYYPILGPTGSPEEFNNYYTQSELAILHAQNPTMWASRVKDSWENGVLELISGARMLAEYNYYVFPPPPEQVLHNVLYHYA